MVCECFEFFYDGVVFVEVVVLEFGWCVVEVVWWEVVGCLVGEVVDELVVVEWVVCDEGDV